MSAEEKKLDPRVIRTRKLLRDAFLELVAEKGYREITIQDITDRATLNRVTFYLHYDNKEDLLVQTTNQLLDELVSRVPPRKEGGSTRDAVLAGLAINFQFFADYGDFMKAMLGKDGVWSFIFAMQDYHYQVGIKRLKELHSYTPERELEIQIVTRHMHSAFMGVIQWWLANDMPLTPEEMAEQVLMIYTQGIYRRMGYQITEEGFFA